MDPLAGKVAWVAGVGEGETEPLREVGQRIALLLAASGSQVLVSGTRERALGACVGEIAHGGGKARHRVGDLGSADDARASVEAVLARFGALDVAVVVSESIEQATFAFDAARSCVRPGGRMIVVSESLTEDAAPSASSGMSWHAVQLGGSDVDEVARVVASLAAKLD